MNPGSIPIIAAPNIGAMGGGVMTSGLSSMVSEFIVTELAMSAVERLIESGFKTVKSVMSNLWLKLNPDNSMLNASEAASMLCQEKEGLAYLAKKAEACLVRAVNNPDNGIRIESSISYSEAVLAIEASGMDDSAEQAERRDSSTFLEDINNSYGSEQNSVDFYQPSEPTRLDFSAIHQATNGTNKMNRGDKLVMLGQDGNGPKMTINVINDANADYARMRWKLKKEDLISIARYVIHPDYRRAIDICYDTKSEIPMTALTEG